VKRLFSLTAGTLLALALPFLASAKDAKTVLGVTGMT
jgi:hypothetical protein